MQTYGSQNFKDQFYQKYKNSQKIYLHLNFLSQTPQIFRKHSFYNFKDFLCQVFEVLKTKSLYKKNHKKAVFFIEFLLFKIRNFYIKQILKLVMDYCENLKKINFKMKEEIYFQQCNSFCSCFQFGLLLRTCYLKYYYYLILFIIITYISEATMNLVKGLKTSVLMLNSAK